MAMVRLDDEVHKALKAAGEPKGMKTGKLNNEIVKAWLRGHVFFLPVTLPQVKDSRRGTVK